MTMRYLAVTGPSIVHEMIDDEVIVVDLDKGLYFSIEGIGAHLWALASAGSSVEDIVRWASTTFADVAGASTDATAFLASLETHGLMRPVSDVQVTDRADGVAPTEYHTPTVQVYSDMEELLLLDPIHEVSDDAGWPHVPRR